MEAPQADGASATSPSINIISVHSQPSRYLTETNLNINDKNSRTPQRDKEKKSPVTNSTPHLSEIRDEDNDDSAIFRPTRRQGDWRTQQPDRSSAIGSDSGIVVMHPSSPKRETPNENEVVERRLTDLVQQLGKQLENDTQKINEKLESKLKKLEEMINQQTYVIRQQDDVIERLKSKIQKIETERDHFRDRLSVHERGEQNGKQNIPPNDMNQRNGPPNKKYLEVSTTTDNSKVPAKKVKKY